MKDRLDNSTNRIGYISERRVLGDVNGAANGEGWCRRPGGLGNEGSSSIVAECIRAYTAKFGDRLFVLDAFVVYLLSCALLLTSYAVATGAFEFGRTALFAAIGSCVGTATLSVCLRTQVETVST